MEVASRGHEAEAMARKLAVPEWFMERTACNSGGHLNATDMMQIKNRTPSASKALHAGGGVVCGTDRV